MKKVITRSVEEVEKISRLKNNSKKEAELDKCTLSNEVSTWRIERFVRHDRNDLDIAAANNKNNKKKEAKDENENSRI